MINTLFDVDAFDSSEGYFPEEVRGMMRDILRNETFISPSATMAAWRKSLREMRGK